MAQSLRQLKSRIKSVQNTKKITRAMEMVSAAKLNRIKSLFHSSKPYFENLEGVLKRLLDDTETPDHPLLQKRQKIKKIVVCILSSDTGLCGAYNNNIIRATENFLSGYERSKIELITIGKEAFSHFNKTGYHIKKSYLGLYGKYSPKVANEINQILIDMFVSTEVDEAYMAYTRFSSRLRHNCVVEKFLNIEDGKKNKVYYALEPDNETILNDLLHKYIENKINMTIIESLTTEHSARMLAMKTATDNAEELINTLTLLRNKARQTAITNEVREIAMSSEALKG